MSSASLDSRAGGDERITLDIRGSRRRQSREKHTPVISEPIGEAERSAALVLHGVRRSRPLSVYGVITVHRRPGAPAMRLSSVTRVVLVSSASAT